MCKDSIDIFIFVKNEKDCNNMLHKCMITKDKIIWKYYIIDYIRYIYILGCFTKKNFLFVRGRIATIGFCSSDPRSGELAAPTTLPCGSTHNQARRVGVSPTSSLRFHAFVC